MFGPMISFEPPNKTPNASWSIEKAKLIPMIAEKRL
jgi:hypothetical protein